MDGVKYLRAIAESRSFLIRLVPLLISLKCLTVELVMRKMYDCKRKKKEEVRTKEMYVVLPVYLLLRTINVG